MDEKSPALCVFIDLAKAFDTVCHQKLFEKLKCMGLRGKVFSLLKSYLLDRVQVTQIADERSEPKAVRFGVPQGTVLGPVLFTIYINDFLKMETAGRKLCFADDTAIMYRADTWNELQTTVERDLVTVKNWFDLNLLTINFNKSKYILFSSYLNKNVEIEKLNLGEYEIERVRYIKYLGVFIDQHLRWDRHAQHIAQKIRSILQKFKFLKSFLNIKQLMTLYCSLVQSHIYYGILGWGGIIDSHLKSVNVVQKWILKIIYGRDKQYPSNELFLESKVMDARQLFCLRMLLRIFKKPSEAIIQNQNPYNTRNGFLSSFRPRANKSVGQRSFFYLAPRLYDIIPDDLKGISTYKQYVKKNKE